MVDAHGLARLAAMECHGGLDCHRIAVRPVTIRSQGLLGTQIAYSTMRDGFIPATRAVVLEAERRDVDVKASMLNPRDEWDAYLGLDDPSRVKCSFAKPDS